MHKIKGVLFLFVISLTTTLQGFQSDFLTYLRLVEIAEKTGYNDHIPHFRRLFNTTPIKGFLECGCGYSTAYFLNHAEKVISVEYVTPGYGAELFQTYKSLYSDRPNWIPMIYNANLRSNSFNNACAYQCTMHKDYALIDPTYLRELDQHFKSLLHEAKAGGYEINVALVDTGIYLRGDLVKLLLANKVPIVIGHGTASDTGIKEKENLYGWNKVVTPPDYIKIFIPYGQGTTFWIHETEPTVIASMLSYRDGILNLLDSDGVSMERMTQLADSPYFIPQ